MKYIRIGQCYKISISPPQCNLRKFANSGRVQTPQNKATTVWQKAVRKVDHYDNTLALSVKRLISAAALFYGTPCEAAILMFDCSFNTIIRCCAGVINACGGTVIKRWRDLCC